jgi:hypothetical protein
MQSESIIDHSGQSKSDNFSPVNKSESDLFSNRKRKRGPIPKGFTYREEERILKHALKLSEKEHQQKISNEVCEEKILKFSEIEEVKTLHATEEDFSNPLKFFDKLWQENEKSTGIIKIVPPEAWIVKQKEHLQTVFKSRLKDPSKKLQTRKQTLNEFYLAKVN